MSLEGKTYEVMHKGDVNEEHTYPQSINGRGGYPLSGGGHNDGGRLPHEVPILSPNTLPDVNIKRIMR